MLRDAGPARRRRAVAGAVVCAVAGWLAGCRLAGTDGVAFVAPADGATLSSPVHVEFRASRITIAAVPSGQVAVARDGVGHFHVGVDQACVPAGQAVPGGASGWVDFGRGDHALDLQLAPGPHRIAVQVGDDQHRALPGLCQIVTVTVR